MMIFSGSQVLLISFCLAGPSCGNYKCSFLTCNQLNATPLDLNVSRCAEVQARQEISKRPAVSCLWKSCPLPQQTSISSPQWCFYLYQTLDPTPSKAEKHQPGWGGLYSSFLQGLHCPIRLHTNEPDWPVSQWRQSSLHSPEAFYFWEPDTNLGGGGGKQCHCTYHWHNYIFGV